MSRRIMVVDDSRLAQVKMEDVLKGTDYEIAARYCAICGGTARPGDHGYHYAGDGWMDWMPRRSS